jgi:protein-S-isoprenylcysteine O-methyltransferase Ste14
MTHMTEEIGNQAARAARATRPLSAFERTKLCDFLFALPIIVWYAYALGRDYPAFMHLIFKMLVGGAQAADIAGLLARVASFAFALLVILFLVLRDPPIAKPVGILPRLAAVFGAFLGIGFLGLPRAETLPLLDAISAGLILIGSGFAVYALLHLGKSFSVLPEARAMVTSGPFAKIRHPVYLGEQIALIGVMLQFAQPWSLALMLAQFAWQIARMSYEERVLGEAFPAYADYKARTFRLIPGVY